MLLHSGTLARLPRVQAAPVARVRRACHAVVPPMASAAPLHHALLPATRAPADGGKPPLLVLLHGTGADEHDLLDIGHHAQAAFGGDLVVASLRAPLKAPWGGYAWFEGARRVDRGVDRACVRPGRCADAPRQALFPLSGFSSAPEPKALQHTVPGAQVAPCARDSRLRLSPPAARRRERVARRGVPGCGAGAPRHRPAPRVRARLQPGRHRRLVVGGQRLAAERPGRRRVPAQARRHTLARSQPPLLPPS